MRRGRFLGFAAAAAAFPAAARAALEAKPLIRDVRVRSDGKPFEGDRALIATVGCGRRCTRRRAIVSFHLREAARVRIEAVRTDTIRIGRPAEKVVWSHEAQLPAGPNELAWEPGAAVAPRTYVIRLTAWDRRGRRAVRGLARPGRGGAPVVRVLGVDAGFARASYAPGDAAEVAIAADTPTLRLQTFRYGSAREGEQRDLRTDAVAMTPPVSIDWSGNRNRVARLRVVRAGRWASGLYFLKLSTPDGRVGYAPFILRPPRLGATARVAVVLSTNTWQAYNFHDRDGDGWGDSWYVSASIKSVDRTRPYLDFGLPFRFKDWDLTFIAWLNRTRKRVEFLSDDDLETVGTGDELKRAYDLVVFPGHAEYVTKHAYDVVQRYRDLGGNLMFLAANNFFWSVVRSDNLLVKGPLWRDLKRPEASLVGTQYVGSDNGQRRGPFTVVGAAEAPWLFEGTGLVDGSTFGEYGIEIDATTPASPPTTKVLARIPDLMGPGRSAEMTYYETPAGAKVFSAGAIDFAASLPLPEVERMVENLWARLSQS